MKAKIKVRSIPTFCPQEKPFEVTDNGLVLRIQPSGVATFYVVYRVDGRNRRYRIGNAGSFTADQDGKWSFEAGIHPDVAKTVAKEKAGEAAKGKDPQEERKEKRTELKMAKFKTVGGFFEHQYASYLLTGRKSGKQTAKRIKGCFGWLFDKPMSEITPFLLQGWQKKQLEAGKSPITVNRDLADLKSMLSKAVEWDFIAVHPLEKMKPAKTEDNSRVRYLSPDEEKRLFAALAQREAAGRQARTRFNEWRQKRDLDPLPEIPDGAFIDHLNPLVILALNTGLRRGELFSLEWRDIDFLHSRLTVRAAAAKGAKTRYIPLNATARDVLKRWQKQTSNIGFIFPGRNGKRLDNITSSWSRLVKSAQLKDFTFHDLRHDFATKALKGGADIVTVSNLLGHASLKMTLRYSHVTNDALVEAVERLPSNG